MVISIPLAECCQSVLQIRGKKTIYMFLFERQVLQREGEIEKVFPLLVQSRNGCNSQYLADPKLGAT